MCKEADDVSFTYDDIFCINTSVFYYIVLHVFIYEPPLMGAHRMIVNNPLLSPVCIDLNNLGAWRLFI